MANHAIFFFRRQSFLCVWTFSSPRCRKTTQRGVGAWKSLLACAPSASRGNKVDHPSSKVPTACIYTAARGDKPGKRIRRIQVNRRRTIVLTMKIAAILNSSHRREYFAASCRPSNPGTARNGPKVKALPASGSLGRDPHEPLPCPMARGSHCRVGIPICQFLSCDSTLAMCFCAASAHRSSPGDWFQ